MEFIVGREGNQPFQINDRSVSRKHVKCTLLPNGKIQLEDLGSSGGTYVNGMQIVRKEVDMNSVVMLGSNYQLSLAKLFPQTKPSGSPAQQSGPEQVSIRHLKKVWDNYNEEKIRLQQDNTKKQMMMRIPSLIPMVIAVVFAFVGQSNDPIMNVLKISGVVISLVLMIVMFKKSSSASMELPVKMNDLNNKFQVDYVCPKCKRFLGFTPYEGLVAQGKCSCGKAEWKE